MTTKTTKTKAAETARSAKKTVTKKTTAKKTTVKKTTAKKTKAKGATKASRKPLSMKTWHLLHVKAVGQMLEDGLAGVGGDVADGIKQKVFAFLGSIPAGIKVIT